MIKQRDEFFKRSQAAQIAATQAQGVQSSRSSRKPLTDDEIMSLALQYDLDVTWSKRLFEFARAIERAHGIGEA